MCEFSLLHRCSLQRDHFGSATGRFNLQVITFENIIQFANKEEYFIGVFFFCNQRA